MKQEARHLNKDQGNTGLIFLFICAFAVVLFFMVVTRKHVSFRFFLTTIMNVFIPCCNHGRANCPQFSRAVRIYAVLFARYSMQSAMNCAVCKYEMLLKLSQAFGLILCHTGMKYLSALKWN